MSLIRIEFETSGYPLRGSFEKVWAYVFANDRNVNIEMVRQGVSRFYAGHNADKYARGFRTAELEAKRAQRGLWAEERE